MNWISVKDKMPIPYDWVLVGTNFSDEKISSYGLTCWTIARFSDECGWDFFEEDKNGYSNGPYAYDTDRTIGKLDITHWMKIENIPL